MNNCHRKWLLLLTLLAVVCLPAVAVEPDEGGIGGTGHGPDEFELPETPERIERVETPDVPDLPEAAGTNDIGVPPAAETDPGTPEAGSETQPSGATESPAK